MLAHWQLPSAYARFLYVKFICLRKSATAEFVCLVCYLPQPVHLLVPQGRISAQVQAWLGEPLQAGKNFVRGQLHLRFCLYGAKPV